MAKYTTKDVEVIKGRTIRKLMCDGLCTGYVSGIKNDVGNLADPAQHTTLTEARTACGIEHGPQKITLPKSAYKQNQKGYDPSTAK